MIIHDSSNPSQSGLSDGEEREDGDWIIGPLSTTTTHLLYTLYTGRVRRRN